MEKEIKMELNIFMTEKSNLKVHIQMVKKMEKEKNVF